MGNENLCHIHWLVTAIASIYIYIYIKLPRLSVLVCLSVCLHSGFLENVRTDFHETFYGS